ncbi:MAG TPA: cupin domain-containing protein [Phycisphaerae bacterium]|nr:cupin domain-containing protein [Phycisphaerae bacterium]
MSPTIRKLNLAEAFERIPAPWQPHLAGVVNDCAVKLARFRGEFLWHQHEHEDEMFLVVKGAFTMRLRDGDVHVREGEFIVIPRGVEHLPVAEEEALVLLFEPRGTLNTGNVRDARTVANPPTI